MTEQLISFETAKIAREKGFDWDEGWTKAGLHPSQSHIQKWLRDEKGIVLAVNYTDGALEYYCSYWNQVNNNGLVLGKNHKTYEEALEEGLKEALKLIS